MTLPTTQSTEPTRDSTFDSNNDGRKDSRVAIATDVLPSNDLTWRGGEHYFEGQHDRFCFSCGASDTIFGCQTCCRCYHSQCMFPPLEPSQVPDVWFCPVCVGRTWHLPLEANQTPSITLPETSVAPAHLPLANVPITTEEESMQIDATELEKPNNDTHSDLGDDPESQNRRWRDAQRWKENAWYAPRGYMLDPSSSEKFIPVVGEGPSISLSTVLQSRSEISEKNHGSHELDDHKIPRHVTSLPAPETVPNKLRRIGKGGGRPSPRKRSKYSDLPKELEKALELIASHLGDSTQSRKSRDDVESKSRALEQKMRIQEGEVLLSRQELHAVKQKLSSEVANVEKLKAENNDLRKELLEARVSAEKKESEMKNWQNMLRSMMASAEGESTS